MPQYDGAIRIATKITTKDATESLASLEYQIKKSAKYMDELRSKMDTLKDQKIPTQEFKDLEKELEQAYSALNSLLEKRKELKDMGFKEEDIPKNLTDEIDKAGLKVGDLEEKIAKLNEEGKAFTLGQYTAEYTSYAQQLQYEEESVAKAAEHYNALLGKTTDNYKQLGQVATDALKKLSKSILQYAVAPFKLLGNVAKKAFGNIAKGSKSTNGMLNGGLKNILKYGLGIRSLYALINKLRTAAKEGFNNLVQYSEPLNASMSALKSSLTQLKNSLATAFSPIITTVVPALTTLINMLSKATTYVGMFIATLTGASSFTKAVEVQEDYADALNKTGGAAKKAVKALAGFDKLNVLSQNDNDGGGGAGAISPKDMFEEVEIPNSVKNIAQALKDMWESADFSQLGKTLGEKLKNALDSIPWDKIKESARKIGKSLATLINGFIEVEGLGYSIGNTLAQAINTAFEFLNSFVHNLHWSSIGTFIAETLNGLFENIDWDLIRDTFVTGFKGLADAINSFIADFNWDNISNTISNAINIIVESVYTFFSTVEWEELGQKLGEQLRKTIEKIDWEDVGRAIGSVIQAGIDFVGGFLKEQDFGEVLQAITDVLKGIFEEVDKGELAQIILAGLTVKLAAKATSALFKTAAGAILNCLGKALKTHTEGLSTVASSILDGIGTEISNLGGLGGILKADLSTIIETGTATEIGLTIGVAIIGGLLGALGGGIVARLLDNYILAPLVSFDEELSVQYKNFKWFGENGFFKQFKDSLTDSSWKNAVKLWGDDIGAGLVEINNSFKRNHIEITEDQAEFLDNMTKNNNGTWENIKKDTKGALDLWSDDIYSAFVTLGERQEETFENMKKSISEIWDGLWSNIKGVINSILGGVESMANGVANAINTIIRALNSLQFDIPDWIPGMGGKSFGFDIKEISGVKIPRLADGAVIRGGDPFVAVLGDQRHGQTNIEAPLATIRQAVREELNRNGNGIRSSGSDTFIFQVDGRTFFEVTRKEAQRYFKSTGRAPYPI